MHGDGREVASQRHELGFLGGDTCLGVDDLDVELALLVDGLGVVLGEDVGLLVQTVEFVDDPLDLATLIFDGGEHDIGRHERRHEQHGCHQDGTSGEAAGAATGGAS